MTDEQRQPELEAWFRDRDVPPKDVPEGVTRVMSDIEQSRQRGRWIPLPLHKPTPVTAETKAGDPTHHPSDPIPDPTGRADAISGRTLSMFSPARIAAGAALAFAVGGVLLVAQPFQQQSEVPGAVGEPRDLGNATSFSGMATYVVTISEGTQRVTPEGLDEQTGWVSKIRFWGSDDPRFVGDVIVTSNWVVDGREGFASLQSATYELKNDGGSWIGRSTGFASDDLDPTPNTIIFVGQDGYEGLTAYVLNQLDENSNSSFSGVIFPSAMPEVPEPYAVD